ncbi:unnamed protein product [Diabrotica balteata]|uniref:Band 7 domain-containing protein n=1 Tax=Diabrotica balteata TaxID=107213 RepID=A0A9N9SV84_DIABA|nr:unnamed protein product [Diabrotica balteata]
MFPFNNIFNFALLICIVNGIGIDEIEDVGSRYISSVVVHRSRAFLALPRSVCTDDKEVPTLIETHWDAGHVDLFSRFSQKLTRHKILSSQMWGDCHSIQDAVSLSMEPTKPKFWILDKGNEFCSPKILSYNLVFNHVSDRTELVTIDGSNLNVMVIDYSREEDGGFRAYIGHAEENVILVFSLENLVWWKIHLLGSSSSAFPVRADYLAISKVTPELFITAKNSLNVFSINLIQLRNLKEPHIVDSQDKSLIFNATMLGEKLGTSTGIESDFASGLIYFMVKDYAIVRWNIVVKFNAAQLITQRQQVSLLVRRELVERARDFNIILDDVFTTDLSFGKDYTAAVESKQIAQQEAQRAGFVVEKAKQERQQKIVQAEEEAEAAKMLGEAIGRNPGFLKLRKIRAAQNISRTIVNSQNKVYLSGNSLMLNISDKEFDDMSEKLQSKK